MESPITTAESSDPVRKPSAWIALAVLAAVVLLAFAPTLGHEFVWDDHEQVVDNLRLRHWSSFDDFWRQDILSLSRSDGERSNYWRPLFYVQYLVMYQLFELDTAAWHGGALLLHLLACWAAWWLLVELGFARRLALLAAALFAVHPAHGESVSWIAAAYNDPPAAALLLVGLAIWLRWRRLAGPQVGIWRWMLPWLCYAAALCLKESALSMLLLLPLVDWHRARETGERLVWQIYAWLLGLLAVVFAVELAGASVLVAWPHLALAVEAGWIVGVCLVALEVWRRRDAVGSREARRVVLGYLPFVLVTLVWIYARKLAIHTVFGVFAGGLALAEILPTLPWLALWYLRFLVWPFGLAPSYPVRYLEGWADPRAWAAVLLLAGLAALGMWWARKRPVLWLGGLWIVACVWPVFNTRSFRPAYLVHQRYLYLAVLGWCLAVAWLLWRTKPRWRWPLIFSLLVVYGASNLYHDRFWATDTALWQRVAEVDPSNPAAFDWLGSKALEAGRVEEAEELFYSAIRADPSSPQGHRNLALLLHSKRGQPEQALPHYERALAAWQARGNLQMAERLACQVNYAIALAAVGRGSEALQLLLEAAETPPHPATAASSAAVLLRQAGRIEEAEAVLQRALERHPTATRLRQMLRQLRPGQGG